MIGCLFDKMVLFFFCIPWGDHSVSRGLLVLTVEQKKEAVHYESDSGERIDGGCAVVGTLNEWRIVCDL